MRAHKKFKLLLSFIVMFFTGIRVAAAGKSEVISGNGKITFVENEELLLPTPPIDPERPDEVVEPGGEIVKTEGPLRLDLIPKIVFGAQMITDTDQEYFANAQLFHGKTPARGNYVQVTDNRGTLGGWQLTVRQETQFKNNQTKNKELNGAVLSFDKQWANSVNELSTQPTIVKDAIKIDQIGASYPIAVAELGKGGGTWTIEFGSSGSVEGKTNTLTPMLNADGTPLTDLSVGGKPMYKNQAITLFVPGKTLKDPVKYTTVLTWTLAELT